MKAAGYEFAILRIGYRGYGEEGTLNADEKFEQNMENARKAGILNCWNPLKPGALQHKPSLGVGVNAAKAEKSDGMVYGQTLCTVFNGQPAAKPVRESSTAIRYGVGPRE